MKKLSLLIVMMIMTSLSFAAEVDLNKSEVGWHGTKITGEHYGKIKLKSAKVELDGDKLKNAEFVTDMSSITADDFDSDEWRNKFLTHMKSEDFFEVEKYPTAKLVTKKIEGTKVTADLTIKGKTNPVTFEYKKDGHSYSGEFFFDRTKYDMIYGSKNFFKSIGDKAIHDKVKLSFKIILKE